MLIAGHPIVAQGRGPGRTLQGAFQVMWKPACLRMLSEFHTDILVVACNPKLDSS